MVLCEVAKTSREHVVLTLVVIVVGWRPVTALRGAPLHPVAGVVLEDGVLAPVPPEPGVEVQYPGRLLPVDGAQALELDHELRDHDGAVPLAHPRELRHELPVRGARGADDGDGGARGEAAGQEDDPAARALGDGGGAPGGVGGARGGGGEQRPGVPREGGGLLPGGEAERPGVVGHAVERGAAAAGRARRGGVRERDAVVAVPEGLDGEGGGGGGGGGGVAGAARGQVVGGGGRGEGGGGVAREVGGGQVEHAAELEGDEEEVRGPQRQHQVRRPHPPRHRAPPVPSAPLRRERSDQGAPQRSSPASTAAGGGGAWAGSGAGRVGLAGSVGMEVEVVVVVDAGGEGEASERGRRGGRSPACSPRAAGRGVMVGTGRWVQCGPSSATWLGRGATSDRVQLGVGRTLWPPPGPQKKINEGVGQQF